MVVHLRKELIGPPDTVEVPGIAVRAMVVPEDVEAWLALRERAIAGLTPAPRPWMHADYQAEMFDKPWWNAEHCWLAVPRSSFKTAWEGGQAQFAPRTTQIEPDPSSFETASSESPERLVGTVTLAQRAGAANTVPVVHWLLVDPEWRRRGVGGLLMSHLEQATWDAGWREVQLETHGGWAAAVTFYQSMGYAPLRPPSSR